MKKLLQCDRCQFNAHSRYLVCAVHPDGVDDDRCPDFLLEPGAEELWSPIGFTFIDEQLCREAVTYQVDFEPTLERSRQWVILETYPFSQVFARIVVKVTHRTSRSFITIASFVVG